MQNKNWKKVLGILLSVCMLLTSAQIPGGIQVVHAEGEGSQSTLQSSFATGGLVQLYSMDFENYEVAATLPANNTVLPDGGKVEQNTYDTMDTASAKVVLDGTSTNHVLEFKNDGKSTSSPSLQATIASANRTTKGVLKYKFKITEDLTDSTTLNLPCLKDRINNNMSRLQVNVVNGEYKLRAYDSSGAVVGTATDTLVKDFWYTIEMVVDSDAGKYSVYLGDQPVFENLDLANADAKGQTIRAFSTSLFKTTKATFVIDDLEVYKYAAYTGIEASASASTIEVGGTSDITATYNTATDGLTFPCTGATFKSSSDAVATVDENGKVTGVSDGTATITVTPPTASGLTAATEVAITVEAGEGEGEGTTPTNAYYSEDFEAIEEGSRPEGYGPVYVNTTTSWKDENTTLAVVKDTDDNNYLKFGYDGAAGATQSFFFNFPGEADTLPTQAVFKYRFQVVENSIETYLLRPVGRVNGENGNKSLTSLKLNKSNLFDTNISTSNPIATVENGKWYDFAIVVDYEQDVYYIYLGQNGESTCIAAQSAANAADYIKYMIGGIYNTSVSTILYDDIQLVPYVAGTGVAFAEHVADIKAGEELQLSLTYTPAELSCPGASYSSSNSTIASVSANGKVTGISAGEVIITATPVQKGLAPVTTTITVTSDGTGGASGAILYSEDFEETSGDAKAYLTNEGYKLWNAGDHIAFTIEDEDGNHVLKIDHTKESTSGFSMHYNFGDDNTDLQKVVFKYRVKQDANDGYLFLPRLGDYYTEYNTSGQLTDQKYIKHVYLAWNRAHLYVEGNNPQESTDDWVRVSDAYMNRGEWHDIEIVLDNEKEKYDVYVNGECVLRQADTFAKQDAENIETFSMGILSGSTINAYYLDDIQVLGYVDGQSVAFAEGTPDAIYTGHTEKFELAFTPEDTSVHSAVFSSSDESVATVDAYGNVTGVKAGTVTITADPSLEGLESIRKEITVNEKVAVGSVTVDKTSVSLPVGGHTYIIATVAPENASYPEITYSSSDEDVATVDEWGEIVAMAAGSATITITSNDDESKTATVSVTVTAPTVAKTIYVAANGSDTGDGTENDKVSIKRAMELVAANNDNMTGNIEVILDGGYYQQTKTIEFTDAHGGTNGYSVIWKAAEGAEPVIGGGIKLAGSAFKKWSENEAIYVAEVPAGTDTRQLYVDNVRAIRARSEGGLTNATFQSDYGYTSDNVEIADWKNPDDLELVWYKTWKHSRCGVASAAVVGGKLKLVMEEPGWYNVKQWSVDASNLPVWYENAIELLDEPGEWYLDKTGNKLYYMPRGWEDMSKVTVTIPVVDGELVTVTGTDYDQKAENIHFEGITFADTTWLDPSTDAGHVDHQNNHVDLSIHGSDDALPDAAVTVAKANSVYFTDCTFTRLGITGLKMVDAAQNCMVVGNHFYDISGGGVNIGEPKYVDKEVINPSDKNMVLKNCDVLNNYIHDIAIDYKSATGISVGFAADMDLSNNEIFNIPYSGFHIGYGWRQGMENNILTNMLISNNFLHHTSAGPVHDGGAIYLNGKTGYGDWSGNQIIGNYIKSQMEPLSVIYCDGGATNWTIKNNVVDQSEIKSTINGSLPTWAMANVWNKNILFDTNYTTTLAMVGKDVYTQTGHVYPTGKYEAVEKTEYVYPSGEYYDEDNNKRYTNTQTYADANWPQEALDIIAVTGLQAGYTDLRNGQAEIITSNISENGVLVDAGGSFEIKLTYTDGKDNVVSGGDLKVYYEVEDAAIAEVSENGVITGKAAGNTIVRISVISNNILDVIEGEVYVGDSLSDIALRGVSEEVTVSMSSAGKELDAYAITALDRVIAPDTVEYTVADTSVAKVDADGNLIPVKVGTTTLTVKASLSGKEKTRTYTVNVVDADTLVTNNLSEIFDTRNAGDWYTNQATTWDVVDGESITTILAKYANYKGFKIENEMLHFKLKIAQTNNSGDYPGIQLRGQDYTDSVGSNTSVGYLVAFSNAGLEVYRFNGTGAANRTAFYSPYTKFNPEYGSMDASVFTRDVEHDVQIGAINEEDGVRLILKIDGETVFDFVDEYEDGAIKEAGYFGLRGQSQTITLTKVADESAGGEGEGTTPTPTPGAGEDTSTITQDGLKITITTDKDQYAQDEKITATVSVTNTNSYVMADVSLECIIPDGYQLAEGTNTKIASIDSNETLTFTVVFEPKTSGEGEGTTPTPTPGAGEGETATPTPTPDTDGEEETNDNGDVSDNEDADSSEDTPSDSAEAAAGSATETGDSSNPLLWSVLLLLAFGGAVAAGIWCRKNRKGILSLFLCAAMVLSMLSVGTMKTYAAEEAETASVSKVVEVADKEVTIK